MTSYLIQVFLYVLAIAAIPVALTKRKVGRVIRLVVALCPVLVGLLYYFTTKETSGIFVALMGLWAMFLVTVHPGQSRSEEKEEAE